MLTPHGRWWNTVALTLLIALLGASAAGAQSDTGEIDVTVTDAASHAALADARVILVGPTTASSLTTKAGIIKYTDVPVGIYRLRVVRAGYQPGASKDFEVLGGHGATLSVQLVPDSSAGLRVIGVVTARSSVSVSSTEVTDASAIRRISDSLTDALDKLAGVTVTQGSSDPDAALTVSLRGHDESQTGITLDGIPLAAPGSSANLRQIGTDLFSGSSVDFKSTAGSLGGSVNFRMLQPTQTWQVRGSSSYGTFDKATYALGTTGSIKKLGIAAQHTFRDGNNPLTFQTYQDQSGQTYAHGGYSHSSGDSLKLRYNVDDRTTVSATALETDRYNAALCTQFVTNVACGSGPGNASYGRYGFGYASIQSLAGQIALQATGFTTANTSNSDNLNRYIDGIAAPSLSANESFARGVALSASIAQRRHTLTFTGNTYDSIDQSIPKIGSHFETPVQNGTASTSYQLSDSIKSSDRLTLSPSLSLATSTGTGASIVGGFGAAWQPSGRNTYTAALSFGSAQPGNNAIKSFSDPAATQANCAAGTATVTGPGDEAGHQSSAGLTTAWTHQVHGGQFTLDAYAQIQRGQLIQALISEPVGYFPPGYTSAVNGYYHDATHCGPGAAAPAIYVSTSVGGTARLYEGVDFSGRLALGNNVVVMPTYSLNVARLTAANAALANGNSPTIVGAQLPGRPLHRGGLTIDAIHSPSKAEFLANAQYTGPDNAQHLGAYIVANGGISHGFGPGRLTLFENNIFGTYTASFATDTFAQPQPLSGGGTLQTVAYPLAPRSLTVTYSFVLGGPPPGPSFQKLSAGTTAPADAGGRPGMLFAKPNPPPPGVDPLSLDLTRASCTATMQERAKPLLDTLRATVSAYEAEQHLPQDDLFEVVPHTLPGSGWPYYLELRPKLSAGFGGPGSGNVPTPSDLQPLRALGSILRCAYMTVLSRDDARAKGIQTPPNGRPGLYYVPSLGLVAVRAAQLPPGGGSVKGK